MNVRDHVVTLGILASIVVLVAICAIVIVYKNETAGVGTDIGVFTNELNGTFTDLEGNPVSLADYRGKILFVNAWATWTPFSKDELRTYQVLKGQYPDDIEVLAINRKEPSSLVRNYVQEFHLNEGMVILLDPDDTFYKGVDGFSMPETVVYDREGNKLHHKHGPMTLEEMQAFMERAK